MSDVLANYEHTKRTAPIPAGWLLVEAEDPRCKPTEVPVKFWHSGEQCWQDLTIDANGAPAAFNTLWAGGATCLIVKDPNFVPAPPPAFAPASPSLPFAVPQAPAVPFAAPAAPIAPVPVAAPAPVLAPVVPSVPAPVAVLPMPVAPAIPVPAPVQAPAPVAQANLVPFPVAAPAAPAAPAEASESNAPVSEADPNEVAAWLAARDGVKAQIDALEKVEAELRKKIVKTCFPEGLREGSNKVRLPDGSILTITGVINRKIDQALIPDVQTALAAKNGVAPTGLFKTKYDLDLRTYKALPHEDKMILANCVTETEGSPQLKLSEPK